MGFPGIGGGRTGQAVKDVRERARAGRRTALATRECSATRRPGWSRTSSTSASTARASSTPPSTVADEALRAHEHATPRRRSTRSCAATSAQGARVRLRHQPRRVHHPADRAAGQRPRLLPPRDPDDGRRSPRCVATTSASEQIRTAVLLTLVGRRRRRPAPQGRDGVVRAARCPTSPRSACPARRSWSCRRAIGFRLLATGRQEHLRAAGQARARRRWRDRCRAGRVHAAPVRRARQAEFPTAPEPRWPGRHDPALAGRARRRSRA